MKSIVQEEKCRKGPWTEEEDFKLICFVGLFGDRRWDFIAKVSGLNRTGKSCRLRWVNYLHPDLKRGKMTPQEERLVLELHSKWGNRWSKIATKIPGRTDNEIKNYWRTHMRKEAQEMKKRTMAFASSSSLSPSYSDSCSSASNINNHELQPLSEKMMMMSGGAEETSFHDTGGPHEDDKKKQKKKKKIDMINNDRLEEEERKKVDDHDQEGSYSMDDIWKEIGMADDHDHGYSKEEYYYGNSITSASWDYDQYSLWRMDVEDQESKLMMFDLPISDHQFLS